MAEARVRMTADDLLRLPEGRGTRYELVAGELIEMAPAGGEHGYVGVRFTVRLGTYVEQSGAGGGVFAAETGFRLSREPDTVRAADMAYVAADRLARARVPGYPELAPDLVVEVVSPDDSAADVQAKVEGWLRAGTRLVVVLYPATRSAMLHRGNGTAERVGPDGALNAAPVLPGFTCRLAELF